MGCFDLRGRRVSSGVYASLLVKVVVHDARVDIRASSPGPFRRWVLASAKLEEKIMVFFRVFRAVGRNETKPVVLMCTDPTKYLHALTNGISWLSFFLPQ